MVTRSRSGLSLLEALVAMSVFSLIFLVVHKPVMTVLLYPSKMLHERTDRINGQKIYNRFYLDLRNSAIDQVWTETRLDGKVLVLISNFTDYSQADSEPPVFHTLWAYSPESGLLSRREWTRAEFSESKLPLPNGELTDDQWNSFSKVEVKPVARHLTSFSCSKSPEGVRIEYAIKNERRNGPVSRYALETGSL